MENYEKTDKFKRVYLTKILNDDMECIYRWFSDPEFLKFYDYIPPVPLTKEQVDKLLNDYEKNEESIVFAIRLKESKEIIGGKGYGSEALDMLLEYGFNEFNFHRIQLNVLEFNHSAIALYEKAGFVKEGLFREFVLRDKKRYDLILYGLLRNEWQEMNKLTTIS
jgi:RimJ/RimL family protein N-acetyltransferase